MTPQSGHADCRSCSPAAIHLFGPTSDPAGRMHGALSATATSRCRDFSSKRRRVFCLRAIGQSALSQARARWRQQPSGNAVTAPRPKATQSFPSAPTLSRCPFWLSAVRQHRAPLQTKKNTRAGLKPGTVSTASSDTVAVRHNRQRVACRRNLKWATARAGICMSTRPNHRNRVDPRQHHLRHFSRWRVQQL